MKIPVRNFILISLLLSAGLPLRGQGFVTPVSSISGDAVLNTSDGREISGDLRMAVFGPSGIMSLTIVDQSTGEKYRLKAADIAKLRVKVDGLAKLEMLSDMTSNIRKLATADFNQIVDRKFIYYEQVQIPGKDRFVLTQLLNPGFDSKIKVFDKPIAKTGDTSIGGIAVSGGEAKAYFVIAGNETIEVTRGKYAREYFSRLFGQCPDLLKEFPDPEFKDFASHVLFFEKGCN